MKDIFRLIRNLFTAGTMSPRGPEPLHVKAGEEVVIALKPGEFKYFGPITIENGGKISLKDDVKTGAPFIIGCEGDIKEYEDMIVFGKSVNITKCKD